MRLMMSDNRDSFTFNIVDMLRAKGVEVDVFDNFTPVSEIDTSSYDGLIISPGPGNPLLESDRGNGYALLEDQNFKAVLGICFGHQLIGLHLGGEIYQTEKLLHGEVDRIKKTGEGILKDLPEQFEAVRYHSLAVKPSDRIVPDAVSDSDGTLMGFHSKDSRFFGVQFHPESYYSQYGDEILDNFIGVVNERCGRNLLQGQKRVPL